MDRVRAVAAKPTSTPTPVKTELEHQADMMRCSIESVDGAMVFIRESLREVDRKTTILVRDHPDDRLANIDVRLAGIEGMLVAICERMGVQSEHLRNAWHKTDPKHGTACVACVD